MTALDHVLERTVLIRARRETVFRYFTDSERFARLVGRGLDHRGARRAAPCASATRTACSPPAR